MATFNAHLAITAATVATSYALFASGTWDALGTCETLRDAGFSAFVDAPPPEEDCPNFRASLAFTKAVILPRLGAAVAVGAVMGRKR